ncbi:hypothetical protein SDC9_117192 [bioreactor metagenome]|uniref:Uncharacterized protein n=1 Tax=bioreactor metagenome TaxID=1076179 RepID=A0A645BXY9_9ZZZZ
MVHPSHDRYRIEEPDNQATDTKRQMQEHLDQFNSLGFKAVHQGAKHKQRDEYGNQDDHKGREDQVHRVRHHLPQLLLQIGSDDPGDQGCQNGALVTDQRNDTKSHDRFSSPASYRIGIRQGRRNEHQSDQEADDRQTADLFER